MQGKNDIDLRVLSEAIEGSEKVKQKYNENTEYDASSLETRESITGKCNFNCIYCTDYTTANFDKAYSYWIRLNGSLTGFGIKGLHHTGGEPTFREHFPEYVEVMKKLGFASQVLTTNGARPWIIESAIEAGITRVNISLDTLDPKKFAQMARVKSALHKLVLESVDISTKKLKTVKINVVVTVGNFHELDEILNFAQSKKAVLRLIELYPYGPSIEGGKLDYDKTHVPKEKILEFLGRYGELQPVSVEGINAVPKYFKVSTLETPVALISPEWTIGGATCGRDCCIRLRVGASGNITYCNNIPAIKGDYLENMNTIEMAEAISPLIKSKVRRLRFATFPKVHPFAYGRLRFGIEKSSKEEQTIDSRLKIMQLREVQEEIENNIIMESATMQAYIPERKI